MKKFLVFMLCMLNCFAALTSDTDLTSPKQQLPRSPQRPLSPQTGNGAFAYDPKKMTMETFATRLLRVEGAVESMQNAQVKFFTDANQKGNDLEILQAETRRSLDVARNQHNTDIMGMQQVLDIKSMKLGNLVEDTQKTLDTMKDAHEKNSTEAYKFIAGNYQKSLKTMHDDQQAAYEARIAELKNLEQRLERRFTNYCRVGVAAALATVLAAYRLGRKSK